MPLVGLILVSSLLLLFYFHDKNIISSCAYETAVIGSTKAREREGADAALLQQAFRERIRGKCIFFRARRHQIEVGGGRDHGPRVCRPQGDCTCRWNSGRR